MGTYRRIPSFSWLVAFEAAARHRNFGAAAAALGTSQPAISQRVAHLEAEVGCALFRRLPRGVQLTAEGAALHAQLVDGLDLIKAAVEDVRHKPGAPMALSTDFGFAALWLIPRLPSLRLASPDLDVRLTVSQKQVDVQREPFDAAIIFGSGQWAGCGAELIIPERVVPVCAPALLEGRERPASLEDLRAFPFLHLVGGAENQWLDWPGWFAAAGAPLSRIDTRTAINDYSLVIQAAIAGQGVALGWRPLVDDLLDRGVLTVAFDQTVSTDKGYYLVHRKAGVAKRTVKMLRLWIGQQLETPRTL